MPTYFSLPAALLLTSISCTNAGNTSESKLNEVVFGTAPGDIRGISLPQGFNYVDNDDSCYASWLLNLKLKKDKTVYLFNGLPKSNQDVQYAVLDIAIGKKDLVQCADAAMKLRADFLFEKHFYDEIKFLSTSGTEITFTGWLSGKRWKEQEARLVSYHIDKKIRNSQQEYNSFMEFVFSYCGTYSLSTQLITVADVRSIQPGDIFIQGGFPGHAVTVMAVAKNEAGKKIFLLSQGYMPAQDIHLLKNYNNPELDPWYDIKELYPLYTPQWQFERGSLKRWN